MIISAAVDGLMAGLGGSVLTLFSRWLGSFVARSTC